MLNDILGGYGFQLDFLIDIGISLLAGFLIGAERESRGKPAFGGNKSLLRFDMNETGLWFRRHDEYT